MTDTFDFDDFKPDGYDNSIAALREKAQELAAINAHIAELEEELEAFNKRANHLLTKDMPAIMKDIGIPEFKLDDRTTFKIEDFVSAQKLTPDKSHFQFARQFMVDHGAEGLLKTTVKLEFAPNEHNQAMSVVASLREDGHEVSVQEEVHDKTYSRFGRELLDDWKSALENGLDKEQPPFKELGMYYGTRVKVVGGKK